MHGSGKYVGYEIDRDLFIKSAGDSSSFRALVERFQARVHSIAYRITGNAEDAGDVAQESFVKLHRTLAGLEKEQPGPPLLYRITINTALDHVRKRKRHKTVPLDDANNSFLEARSKDRTDKQVENSEFLTIISHFVARLSKKQQKVFILRDMEDFSSEEVADILAIKQTTVRVHLARARFGMKKMLMKHYPHILDLYGDES